jgi:hypothetical protein
LVVFFLQKSEDNVKLILGKWGLEVWTKFRVRYSGRFCLTHLGSIKVRQLPACQERPEAELGSLKLTGNYTSLQH